MLQGDGVLVAHGLQMPRHDTGHRFHLGLGTESANALDFLGQHHIVVRDVRDDEGAHLALATGTDGTRRTGRQGRQ